MTLVSDPAVSFTAYVIHAHPAQVVKVPLPVQPAAATPAAMASAGASIFAGIVGGVDPVTNTFQDLQTGMLFALAAHFKASW